MELAALEKELKNRTPEEQDRLASFLAILRAKRSPAWQHETSRRLDEAEGWMSLSELKAKHDSVLGQVKSTERQIQNWYVASVHVFREANLGNRSNHMSPKSFGRDPSPLQLFYSRHAKLDPNPLDESS